MADYKKYKAIWNAIKKISSYISKKEVDQVNDATVFPFILNFLKNFSADYRKNKSNSWDYQISLLELPIECAGLAARDRTEKIKYLIGQYNQRLLFYSEDKNNPWVIDDRDENFIRIHKKKFLEVEKKLANFIKERIETISVSSDLTTAQLELEKKRLNQLIKLALLNDFNTEYHKDKDPFQNIFYLDWLDAEERLHIFLEKNMDYQSIQNRIKEIKKQHKKIVQHSYVYYFKDSESIKAYLSASIWEQVNKFAIRNNIIQFFSVIWYAFSAHANLLSQINFLFLFFSLSIFTFPIVFLIIAISLFIYLTLRFIFFIKDNYTIIVPKLIGIDKADKLLECIKIEVFNQNKFQKESNLILEQIASLTNYFAKADQYINTFLGLKNNIDCYKHASIIVSESVIYQCLMEVYPKTQLVAALIINLTNVLLCTYLLAWAVSVFLSFLGAAALSSIVASPLVIGIFIIIIASFFLIRLVMKVRAKEDCYTRTIINLLNEKCDYSYKESTTGKYQVIQLEKWKKFEFLLEDIDLLIDQSQKFLTDEEISPAIKQVYRIFSTNFYKKNIYNYCDQSETKAEGSFYFQKLKKILNRFFVGSAGGFYGFGLAQQIAFKSTFSVQAIIKVVSLPLQLALIGPFIIVNAIANIVIYHLNSRQRDRLFFAEHLDSKLEVLELTKKKLLYLTALIKVSSENASFDSHGEIIEHNTPSNSRSLPYCTFFTENTTKSGSENESESNLNRGLEAEILLIKNSLKN